MDPVTIGLLAGAAGLGLGAGSKFLEKKPSSKQYPTLSKEQIGFQNKLLEMLGGKGGLGEGSAFQSGQNYLQQLLSGSPEAMETFERPYLKQFEEQTVPGLAERFGGIGAQSSSAFQQALARAGTDLSENLASLRGGLQMQALPQALQYATSLIPGALHNRFNTGTLGGGPGALSQFLGPILGGFGGGVGQGAGTSFANKYFK